MSEHRSLILAGSRCIAGVGPVLGDIAESAVELEDARRAAERGHFTPEENDRVLDRFSKYLYARAELQQAVRDLKPLLADDPKLPERTRREAFIVAYTAACVLVQAGRFIVDSFAEDKVIQRKLNEPEPRFGIPRKQFTAVYRALTDPFSAWQLRQAMQFAETHREQLAGIAAEGPLAPTWARLEQCEDALRIGVRRYVKARLRYRWHSLRRRRASASQQAMFAVYEASGRMISEVRAPWRARGIPGPVQTELGELLRPGDVLVTRFDGALSNIFLPGYWPHAALHIGVRDTGNELGVAVPPEIDERWSGPVRMLEARKDGVLLRQLDDTLSVDAVAVIRPRLAPEEIRRGIERALEHEGKAYDFDFDFFRSDCLVCTEVVYRGFDGLGALRFALSNRAGRPTLSAEDLLDHAVEGKGFDAVAVYGPPSCGGKLVTGDPAREALAASYRV